MKMGEWEDAERDLLDALAKDPRHADTLANLAVVAPRTGKSAARHLAQLKAVSPGHPAVLAIKAHEEAFERAEQQQAVH
jgi:coatomer subunit epsilon